ncbi:hypothetical protein CTI12_AA530670 [Artemisia annua]|uniref:DUF4220 domain-containing protein n=1 Tax=Artemisia annua TaxID=35608 RepID=A0A2U1L4P0_ARTAN|nr:hypothetical protein CTI12_AA530670 [Artemisia annua]
MGNLGSPRLHYLESFITNISNSLCSIQKTNKYKLDNNAIVPREPPVSSSQAPENEDLLSFWAPFLLVYVGGPDTITAFAMEDNELWLHHLFGLLFQCLAAVYVFIQSILNNLRLPTMLMFMPGIIKYAERTRSLYLASADRFKDSMLTGADPGPNYAKLMDEYFSKRMPKLPTRIEMVSEPDRAVKSSNKAKKGNLTELEVVDRDYLRQSISKK